MNKNHKRRKIKRKNPFVVITVLIILAGAGVLGYYVFNITKIEVAGIETKTAEYIINLSRVEKGGNIFKINDSEIKENIEKDPYLKFVEVQRNYPDAIVIVVRERKPAALVRGSVSLLLIDGEGYVLEILKDNENHDYPAVSGIGVSAAAVGRRIGFADEAQFITMNGVLSALDKSAVKGEVSEIDLININDIKILTKDGFTINLGNIDALGKKIQLSEAVMKRLLEDGKKSGKIDVSSGQFATFRE